MPTTMVPSMAQLLRRCQKYQAAPAATAVTPAANPQQPITIINNYYNGATPPMSQANGLFGR